MSEMSNIKDACTIFMGIGEIVYSHKDPKEILQTMAKFIDENASNELWKPFVEKLKNEYADPMDDFRITTRLKDLKKIINEKYGDSTGRTKSMNDNLVNWTTSASSFYACDGSLIDENKYYPRSALTKGDSNDLKNSSSSSKTINQLKMLGFKVDSLEKMIDASDGKIKDYCNGRRSEYNSKKVPINEFMKELNIDLSWESINREASVPKKYMDDVKGWSTPELIRNWGKSIEGSELTYGLITKNIMREEEGKGKDGKYATTGQYQYNKDYDEQLTERTVKSFNDESLQALMRSIRVNELVSIVERDVLSVLDKKVDNKDPGIKKIEAIFADIRQNGGKIATILENYVDAKPDDIYRDFSSKLRNIKLKYGDLLNILTSSGLSGIGSTPGSPSRFSSTRFSSPGSKGSRAVNNFLDMYDGGQIHSLNIMTIASTTPSLSHLKWAKNLLAKKHTLLQIDIERLATHINSVKKQFDVYFKALLQKSKSVDVDRDDGLGERVLMTAKSYVRSVRKALGRFTKKQSEFVTWTNKTPFEYMIRWSYVMDRENKNGVAEDDRAVKVDHVTLINAYFESLLGLSGEIEKALDDAYRNSIRLLDENADLLSSLNDDYLVDEYDTLISDYEAYSTQLRTLIARQFSQNAGTIFDIVGDTSIMVVYAIKGLRMVLTWVSLTLATKIFSIWYSDAVYSNTNLKSTPPSILWFIAIYEGIDSLLNLLLIGILFSIKYIFDDGDFFLNSRVVSATIVDVIVVKLVDTFMSSIIASIVASKKYFRYRFEGDRAVRALESMLLWTASVNTLIPYFRFFT